MSRSVSLKDSGQEPAACPLSMEVQFAVRPSIRWIGWRRERRAKSATTYSEVHGHVAENCVEHCLTGDVRSRISSVKRTTIIAIVARDKSLRAYGDGHTETRAPSRVLEEGE